jgi:uncharacterized membrane protein
MLITPIGDTMIEDAAKNAVIGQVILILASFLVGPFAVFGLIVYFGGLAIYLAGMKEFSEIYMDGRIFQFAIGSAVVAFFALPALALGSLKIVLGILVIAFILEFLANYFLYRASGVPAVLLGYALIVVGVPLMLVYIGALLILLGRLLVIYGYYSIPEIYRMKRKARKHMGLA